MRRSTCCCACIAWKPPSARGPLLREMWRVLAPEGRLLIIVPNRRGVWARFDTTPFGHGRPYSRGPARAAAVGGPVHAHRVVVGAAHAARRPQWLLRWATAFERMGARLWPAFAGVVIVEARKELMGAIPKGKPAKRRIRLVPARGLPRDCPQARAHFVAAAAGAFALMNSAIASTASASMPGKPCADRAPHGCRVSAGSLPFSSTTSTGLGVAEPLLAASPCRRRARDRRRRRRATRSASAS